MPQALLKFDLDDPEDRREFERANKALSMSIALDEIRGALRSEIKYNYEKLITLNGHEALEKFRDEFGEILASNNLNLDEI